MESNVIDAITVGESVAAADLSIWGLFLRADVVVKAVIVVLFFASFWCWAIIFEKWLRLRRVWRRAADFEESFWSGGSLEDLYDSLGNKPTHPLAAVFSSAMREWQRSSARNIVSTDAMRTSLQQRMERAMLASAGREMDRLERYMIFLASAGSTAPFIGLFGTVWGIMNSFQAIAVSKNTNLAVVAPGIAEALMATALGLVVAIPAVVAYNKFNNDLGRYAARLDGFTSEFGAILSRQIEERA